MTRTAIITGGNGDIALCIAQHLLDDGWRVILFDLAFPEPGRIDPRIETHALDISSAAQVQAALDKIGVVPDLLVNAAATIRFGPMLDQPLENFRRVIDVNLCGTFIPAQLIARGMAERGSGIIINFTSINAINPGPNTGIYPASKAAVLKLTQQMSVEWAPLGIRVNAIAPGFIDCGMSASVYSDPKIRAERSAGVPARRLGLAEDIAAAVMFLASDGASYIHGHHLVVDGGVSNSLLAHLKREAGGSSEKKDG